MRKILVAVMFLLLIGRAEAAYLDLAWDPNTEGDLAGYQIYFGTESGMYTDLIDVGNASAYQLNVLLEHTTYYIALTAYDTVGNESDYSAEVFGMSMTDDPQGDPDSDGDGLPDEWETLYFGSLSEGAAGDYEGDELSNIDEYH